jgi:hypothetical protein
MILYSSAHAGRRRGYFVRRIGRGIPVHLPKVTPLRLISPLQDGEWVAAKVATNTGMAVTLGLGGGR